jgi:Methyltransferase domain
MQLVIRKVSTWLYSSNLVVKSWRAQRMKSFLSLVQPPKQARILDLGGTPYMWQLFDNDFKVTLVNLPGTFTQTDRLNRFTLVEGDATNLSNLFEDKSFDIVFSNSVIEHVGDEEKQAAFAAEVKRLAHAYWVQTPSDRFPLEPHTGVLFYWKLPQWVRDRLIRSWEQKLPAWTEAIKHTGVLSRKQMTQLFPDAHIYIERKFAFEKSYTAYRPFELK